jgi:hypothetical protein
LDAYGKHLTFSTTAQQDVMALGLVRAIRSCCRPQNTQNSLSPLSRLQVRLVYSGAGDAMLVLSAEQVCAPPRR